MSNSSRFPFTWRESVAFVALGVVAAFLLPPPSVAPARAAPIEVTDARTCAALAVYMISEPDDWALSASVAAVVLNNFEEQRDAAECGSLVGQQMGNLATGTRGAD